MPMSVRTIKYELEAKLIDESSGLFSKPSGKVERKSYGDGTERLKISVRNLKAPKQSIAIIKVSSQEIAQLPLIKGSGRLDDESKDPTAFPTLEAGQTIKVYVDSTQVLSGDLSVD